MSNYRKGRSYEYRIKKKLEKEGWLVIRSAGSHSLFDLIAIKAMGIEPRRNEEENRSQIYWYEGKGGEIKLIQAKSGKSKLRMVKDVLKTDIKKWEGLYSVRVEVV